MQDFQDTLLRQWGEVKNLVRMTQVLKFPKGIDGNLKVIPS